MTLKHIFNNLSPNFLNMRKESNAFTLVELIVVITILWILGAVWFLSFQGQTANARNSSRSTELQNISKQVQVKTTEWISVLAAVDNATALRQLGAISIAWHCLNLSWSTYKAWNTNYAALWMEEFLDPKSLTGYKIWATTKVSWWAYEVAAAVEKDWVFAEGLIVGTWEPRAKSWAVIKGWGWTSTITFNKWVITDQFKKWDAVTDGTTNWTITKISTDGQTITLSFNASAVADTTLLLSWADTLGLVAQVDADGSLTTLTEDYPVINWSGSVPYR